MLQEIHSFTNFFSHQLQHIIHWRVPTECTYQKLLQVYDPINKYVHCHVFVQSSRWQGQQTVQDDRVSKHTNQTQSNMERNCWISSDTDVRYTVSFRCSGRLSHVDFVNSGTRWAGAGATARQCGIMRRLTPTYVQHAIPAAMSHFF